MQLSDAMFNTLGDLPRAASTFAHLDSGHAAQLARGRKVGVAPVGSERPTCSLTAADSCRLRSVSQPIVGCAVPETMEQSPEVQLVCRSRWRPGFVVSGELPRDVR